MGLVKCRLSDAILDFAFKTCQADSLPHTLGFRTLSGLFEKQFQRTPNLLLHTLSCGLPAGFLVDGTVPEVDDRGRDSDGRISADDDPNGESKREPIQHFPSEQKESKDRKKCHTGGHDGP